MASRLRLVGIQRDEGARYLPALRREQRFLNYLPVCLRLFVPAELFNQKNVISFAPGLKSTAMQTVLFSARCRTSVLHRQPNPFDGCRRAQWYSASQNDGLLFEGEKQNRQSLFLFVLTRLMGNYPTMETSICRRDVG